MGVVNLREETADARILAAEFGPIITAVAGTTGVVSVLANDISVVVNISGAVLIGANRNLGMSSAIVEMSRTVTALIGTPTGQSPLTSTFTVSGPFQITANADGVIAPAALAATKNTGGQTQPSGDPQAMANTGNPAAASSPNGSFGWAISGDFSWANVNDTVLAYINDKVTLTGKGGTLGIKSTDNTLINLTTGAFAFQGGASTSSSLGLAGSASVATVTADVEAFIESITIHAMALELLATNGMRVGSLAAGGNANTIGNSAVNVAGSIAYNSLNLTTKAWLSEVTGTNLANIDLEAKNAATVWAAAGTMNLLLSANGATGATRAGFGMAGALNSLNYGTSTLITGSTLNQASGGITDSAPDTSASYAFAAGIELVQNGAAAAGMFTDTKAVIQTTAQISSSTPTSASADSTAGLVLVANLLPILVSVAGNVVSTKSSSSFSLAGAGVAVTVVTLSGSSQAGVNDSTISLAAGDVQVAGLAGPPSNVSELGTTLAGLNLPHLDSNAIYSFAFGATASNAEFTGSFSVTVNNVNAWNVTGEITSGSSVTTPANINVQATDDSAIYSGSGAVCTDSPGSASAAGMAFGGAVSVNSFVGTTVSEIDSSMVAISGNGQGTVAVSANSSTLVGTAAVGVTQAGTAALGTSVV